MAVVNHEEAPLVSLIGNQGQQGFQVLLRGTLPDHEVHAPSQLFFSLGQSDRLMVGTDAGADISIQVFTGNTRSMSVNHFAPRRLYFTQHRGVARENAGIVHHLAQADAFFKSQNSPYILGAQAGPRSLQVGRRYAGRRHQKQVERQTPGAVQHVLYTLQAAHIGNFVQVGDNARSAVRHHRPRVLADIQHGAFQVGMPVDETGRQILSV
ncbi:hypothetical protein ES703_76472 [subsurface metagenome]